MLSHFKEPFSDEWNLQMLSEGFEEEERKLITQVKPGGCHSKSSYSWSYNANGDYTVKSGYWVWKNIQTPEEEIPIVSNPSLRPLFQALWKTKAPPKIRHFIWRCLSNCVSTGLNMKKKRLTQGGGCPRCLDVDEDINHILFKCHFARLIWALSPACHLFYPQASDSIYENLSKLLLPMEKRNEDETKRLRLWPWILWQIWKSRNDIVFSAIDSPPVALIEDALLKSHQWYECNSDPSPIAALAGTTRGPQKWKPPEEGYLMCNTDGTWSKDKDSSGIGWILRNHQGHVIHLGAKCLPRLISLIHVEAAALIWAVNCVSNLGYRKVIFESDSSNLIQAITNPQSWPNLSNFTSDIRGMSSSNHDYKFKFFSRSGNSCADAIATAMNGECVYFATLESVPPWWLQPLVNNDVRGLVSNSRS